MHCRKDKDQPTNTSSMITPRKAMTDMRGCDFRSAQGSKATMPARLGYMRERQGLQKKRSVWQGVTKLDTPYNKPGMEEWKLSKEEISIN